MMIQSKSRRFNTFGMRGRFASKTNQMALHCFLPLMSYCWMMVVEEDHKSKVANSLILSSLKETSHSWRLWRKGQMQCNGLRSNWSLPMMKNHYWQGLEPTQVSTSFHRSCFNHDSGLITLNLRRDRKNSHNVKQAEVVYVLTATNGLRLMKKNRFLWFETIVSFKSLSLWGFLKSLSVYICPRLSKLRSHFNGTNRGDVIYGVKMIPYDHPDTWKLTVRQKREMYGKHRIAVGSKCPEGTDNEGWVQHWHVSDHKFALLCILLLSGRKADTVEEPAFFHGHPWCLDDELISDFSAGAINDLTPGRCTLSIWMLCWPYRNIQNDVESLSSHSFMCWKVMDP